MNAIATAIQTRGTASSNFNTSIGGRLYFVKAPQIPVFPFVKYFIVNHSLDQYFNAVNDSTQVIDDITCQFNIHSNTIGSSSEAGTILIYLRSQFDNCSLSITGYNSHKMRLTNIFGPFWIEEDESWTYALEYYVTIQKS